MIDAIVQALSGAVNAVGSTGGLIQNVQHSAESMKADLQHQDSAHKASLQQKDTMHNSSQITASSEQTNAAGASAMKKSASNEASLEKSML